MKKDRLDRERQGNSYHLIFNFQRLVECLKEARHGYLNGSLNNQDVLPRARQLKMEATLDFLNKQLQLRGSP
jgi:hypothetical protein